MSGPARPRQAATVILLRPSTTGGFEVFLTRRREDMPFLGGMYCYPGGTIRKEDCAPAMLERCAGLTPRQAQEIVGQHMSPERALGLWVAAAREVFEEVGVLFAVEEDGRPFIPRAGDGHGLAEQHRQLLTQGASFCRVLKSRRLRCDLSRLTYFSHWQTPAQIAMRFDTRFFLASLPPRQTPLETSREVAHSLWIAPERALRLFAAGGLPLIFPTFAALRTLADFETVERVFEAFLRPGTTPA